MRPVAPRPPPARRPPDLRPGDLVQPIAPSGAYDPAALAAGVALLASWGLRVGPLPPLSPPADAPYLAAADAQRLAHLQAAVADPDTAAVWAVRGGSGAGRLAAQLGGVRAQLRRRPLWLVGFSDITVLHQLWAQAGVQSVHAANLNGLGGWAPAARAQLRAILGLGRAQLRPLRGSAGRGPGRALLAPLAGGNLTVLASLVGTELALPWAGKIVLLEDVNEPPFRLDRAASQLRAAGVSAGAAAVVLGQLDARPGRPPAAARRHQQACQAAIWHGLGPGAPRLAGLAVGHRPQAWPLCLGALARLAPGEGTLEVPWAGGRPPAGRGR